MGESPGLVMEADTDTADILMFLDDEIENQFFQDTTIEEEIVMGDQGSDDTSRGPYKKYEPMTIQQLESLLPGNLFLQFMRFAPEHFVTLLTILSVPGTVKAFGYALSGVEALAIYLMRLSTLGGNGEIGLIFKRPACCISMCASQLSSDLFWGKLEKIASMDHDWLNYSNLSEWGQALVAERYFPLSTIAGFVDGKCIRCCRPTVDQKLWYCCHHADHVFKFQIITWLNGMLTAWGPFPAKLAEVLFKEMSESQQELVRARVF